MIAKIHIMPPYTHGIWQGQRGWKPLGRQSYTNLMKIAVIGAGIGGLAAAALLHDAGFAVTLFERFVVPRPIGSGLVIQPVGLAVLDVIGAGQAARDLGTPIAAMLGHAGRRAVLDVQYRADTPGLGMHRGALFQCLWDSVQARGLPIQTGAQVIAAPLTGDLRHVQTDAALHGPYDLAVDASGAASVMSPLQARPVGFGAIWGHVPWPSETALPKDRLTQRYLRAERMAGVLPIGRLPGSDTNLAAVFWSLPQAQLPHWQATDFEAWRSAASTFWPEFAPFLAGLSGSTAMTPARYTHGTLSKPYAPALAFIGDAAHRASPQLGQGANMALLDALALAIALRGENPLPAYAAMRRWHVRSYQAMSTLLTPMYQSHSRSLPRLRDHILAPLGRFPPVRAALTRLVSGDLLPPLAGQIFP